MHYFIGDLGHLFVITAFVTSLLTAWSYWRASRNAEKSWLVNGRFFFYAHTISVVGAGVALFVIINNHYFEYNYAFSYSDRRLPTHYLLSTF